MKVSELGEFGLIELLSGIVSKGLGQQVVLGIGDDAAAWQSKGATLLATTDTMVQGVHFSALCTWRELGWKSMAVNLSDIAAMGGIPQYALVSLSLPRDMEVDDVTQLYYGLAEAAKRFNVAVVGGNISSAPLVTVTITLIGQAQDYGMLTRSAAKPGDLIAVTGYLGSSAAGMRMLAGGIQMDPVVKDYLRGAHLKPQPRIVAGQVLVKKGVLAAIDISDGLIADLGHLCKASNAGAVIRIDWIPVHPAVRENFVEDSTSIALTGGEDYELLFTAASEEVIDSVRKEAGCPVTVIGEITEGEGVTVIDEEGKPVPVFTAGWEHFKQED